MMGTSSSWSSSLPKWRESICCLMGISFYAIRLLYYTLQLYIIHILLNMTQITCTACQVQLLTPDRNTIMLTDPTGTYLLVDNQTPSNIRYRQQDDDVMEVLLDSQSTFDNCVFQQIECSRCEQLLGRVFLTHQESNSRYTIDKYVIDTSFIHIDKKESLLARISEVTVLSTDLHLTRRANLAQMFCPD